ncbi:cysteine desulfuration protein SufE [Candidatus Ishikawella capsulata]|uniref:Cysteine desufuration protein SufE n=1 Tax=Candidatus Ishikawaella capsulata Mpkobe TaxID=476281 RepID=C5WD89_9ENTR|nr:cysteine desulfuration protein SufE [Candidatus Ishikawaella capsulata]BAH83295.1 cysteine desufuration protein SufE [Candidatus Ishikawaella capsulata Mpkobe]
MVLPDKYKILRNFNSYSNWEDKYLYIISLGSNLSSSLSDILHKPEYIISGCQSQVWIRMELQSDGTIFFQGDSDASIVKGLIAIVFSLYQGMNAKEILEFDVFHWLKKFNLTNYLTPSRRQGIESIIKNIRLNAESLAYNRVKTL